MSTPLWTLGGWGKDWQMANYLLFESAYCKDLIRIGYEDDLRQREDIKAFLGTIQKDFIKA